MDNRAAHRLTRLQSRDVPPFRRHLIEAGLPSDDFSDTVQIYQLESGGKALAWAAPECAGPEALLRSIVVPSVARGRGMGREVVSSDRSRARPGGGEALAPHDRCERVLHAAWISRRVS